MSGADAQSPEAAELPTTRNVSSVLVCTLHVSEQYGKFSRKHWLGTKELKMFKAGLWATGHANSILANFLLSINAVCQTKG